MAPADISNSDFDINILDDAFSKPSIDLTFPLPIDKKTYVSLEANHEDIGIGFSLIGNFLHYFTSINYKGIYTNNEYKYSVNKFHPEFHKKMHRYMDDRLENSDEKLDELVHGLIDKELNLKLIKPDQYYPRFHEVKAFIVKYYKAQNIKNMPTFESTNFMRIAYVTVMKLFFKMFPQGVWCSNQEFSAMYKRYLDDPMSIIFLPNHQSHVDYIIIHLLAVRFQFATPTVIAGENLNVAVFGKYLKNLGAIFIPRSMNNELYTERNLSNLIEFMLINKIHVEVFIEGTRSRDGKLLLPKYGILKTFAKIFLKQRLEDKKPEFDLQFQPMSITYERIYETDGYLKELIGKDKKQESFLSIINNGIKNLFGEVEDRANVKIDKDGFNDNKEKTLSGKIFIKLGDAFKISDFIKQEGGPAAAALEAISSGKTANINNDDAPIVSEDVIESVNLKKLGFKILHEINRVSFLPEAALVGAAIHTHRYFHHQNEIPISELIPVLRFIVDVLYHECEDHATNRQILQGFKDYTDGELTQVVKNQIVYFFKFVSVNSDTDIIRIEHSIELLYYKNLTIHLIIQRCKAAFVLLLLNDEKSGRRPTFSVMNKLNYILTGFMKNEFLFDYDYSRRNELDFILKDFEGLGIIKHVDGEGDGHYEILDFKYLELFGNLVKPFLQSYVNLISNFFSQLAVKQGSFALESRKYKDNKDFDYDELRYPTTKTLLKYIISENQKSKTPASTESVNKQYLLSDLYYLNNLRLIQIFKNKAKTKAFVKVKNERDLNIIRQFLDHLVRYDSALAQDEININYVVDVIDKNFDRELPRAKL